MGNYVSVAKNNSSHASGKVVLVDGTVYVFDKPLTVAELMLEYPQQVVVELTDKGLTQKRPSPLPADKNLEVKKVYIMLPMKRGKVASLSSEEARHVLFSANKVLGSRATILSSSRFLPLFAKICPLGDGEGDKFAVERGVINNVKDARTVERCNSLGIDMEEVVESRPEYLNRQLSGKGWKPSLDAINEKVVQKKVPHWLF